MHFGKVYTDAVTIRERLRAEDPAKIKALAASMAEIGLQQPISVWAPNDETCHLVAGLHVKRMASNARSKWASPSLKLPT